MSASDLHEILALPLCDARDLQADGSLERQPAITLPGSPFLTIAEAAHWLGVSVSTVKRLIRRGELINVQIGARRKIPNTSLTSYVTRGVMFPGTTSVMTQLERPINNTARL
jgi:excisionase family DNA binding protein